MVAASPNAVGGNRDGLNADRPRPAGPMYQPLVIVLVAVCVGILADRFRPMPVGAWWTVAGISLVAWLPLWRRGWERAAAVVLLAAVAATAGSWHHCRWFLFRDDELGRFAREDKQPVCLEAVVLKSPRVIAAPKFDPMRVMPAGDRSRVELEAVAIRDGARWRAASGRTRLTVFGPVSGVQAGGRVRVFGQVFKPQRAMNPGVFDYADYARADRRLSGLQCQFPQCVSVLDPGGGWSLPQLIDRARCHGNRLLKRHLDPQRWPLAAAVLLGVRDHVDPDQKQAFMETGTIHLLAISGLHVGILAGASLFVVRRAPIPRGFGLLSVALLAVFYMLLADARPPVIRATMLVLVVCCALYLYRRPLSFNSLAAAALIVLAVNPTDLFQTGAQLSFLAVAGLMWFGPRWIFSTNDPDPLDRMIARSRGPASRAFRTAGRFIWDLALMSVIIWLVTMPLVMARFHLFTPVSIVLNTLLWIPMATALMTGFGTLVFGSLAVPLGQVFGWLCDANLALLQTSVGCAREIPGSHFWVPGPADWWLVGFYGCLALLVAFPRLRPPRRWCLALLAAWSTVGFAVAGLRHDLERPHGGRLDCTFLSMGHGCAVVLELPSGQTMLYDAGQFGSPVRGTHSIAGFLWSRGITHLDAVIISHADLDHYNALPGLLERFSVGAVYVSPVMWEEENRAMAALRKALDRAGVPIREIRAGDRLVGGRRCTIEVLHPPERGVLGADNANSIVLDVGYLGHRILLPGDLDTPGLDDVLAEEPIDCDVLLAPHHGSRRSNPPGLAAWSTPEWVVVSGSRRWESRPIEATYRDAGSRVFHTADVGAVTVTIDAAGATLKEFLPPPGD